MLIVKHTCYGCCCQHTSSNETLAGGEKKDYVSGVHFSNRNKSSVSF